MRKKNLIVIILLFVFLTSLEIGIFDEVLWHGWGGYGDVSMEYTTLGFIGSIFLIFFIPVSIMVIFIICITMGKKRLLKKELFLDCICALFGIGIAIGLFFVAPDIPVFALGRQLAVFFIDYFNWMEYPVLEG